MWLDLGQSVFNFEQTHFPDIHYESAGDRRSVMLTSAECRAMAEQKLAQAERDDHQHRRRLLIAAEGWLLLASKLRDTEASFPTDKPVTTRRPKNRVKTTAATI
jgi:hypothetical protein